MKNAALHVRATQSSSKYNLAFAIQASPTVYGEQVPSCNDKSTYHISSVSFRVAVFPRLAGVVCFSNCLFFSVIAGKRGRLHLRVCGLFRMSLPAEERCTCGPSRTSSGSVGHLSRTKNLKNFVISSCQWYQQIPHRLMHARELKLHLNCFIC